MIREFTPPIAQSETEEIALQGTSRISACLDESTRRADGRVARHRIWPVVVLWIGLAGLVRPAYADRVQELVRIHLAAIGGQARVAALKSMRATGEVIAGGQRMKFTLIAARPNRIRLETENKGRTLVQAYDGEEAPWQFDTGIWPPHYETMPEAAARVFTADAEFDDPLVAGSARGFSIDDAGEVPIGDKKMRRLLVTRNLTETYSILLDPDTCLIVKRVESRKDAFGQTVHVVTDYGDYRPTDGVLVPHLVALSINGRVVQQTRIDAIEPNPETAADTFTRPKASRR